MSNNNQVCEHCLDLKEIPGQPAGSFESPIGDVKTYTRTGDKPGTIILATDVFGVNIPNPLLLADRYHEAFEGRFTVVVPDLFNGDAINPKDFNLKKHTKDQDPQDLGEAFGAFTKWIQSGHGPDDSYPIIQKLIEYYAAKGPIAISGYCYGGKLAVKAAINAGGANGPVKGIVLNHPSMLEPGEAPNVKTPTLLNLAETDPIFTPEVKEVWFKALEANKVLDPASKTYPGTVHGFTCRPDLSRPELKEAFETATSNTITFFRSVLV